MPQPQAADLSAFLAKIQKECLPGIWSKGVALGRGDAVRVDARTEDEITLRVLTRDRPVSPKVTLWPKDEDCYCDCGDRNEICVHIAAAAIFLRNAPEESKTSVVHEASAPRLIYRLSRIQGALGFERLIASSQGENPLTESLVAWMGGVSSGRIASAPLSATREDFSVDAALTPIRRDPKLEPETLVRLLKALSGMPGLTLDGAPVQTSPRATGIRAVVTNSENLGFKICGEMDQTIQEVFSNSAALCTDGSIRPLSMPTLSPELAMLISKKGLTFDDPAAIARLVSVVLPSLEGKLPIEVRTTRLPRPRMTQPRVEIRLESPTGAPHQLEAIPSLTSATELAPDEIAIHDPVAEEKLRRKLQQELHLTLGGRTRFEGPAAVNFVKQIEAAKKLADFESLELKGPGLEQFKLHSDLSPLISVSPRGHLDLSFDSKDGTGSTRSADPNQVWRAWQEGADYVSLQGGGWAPLPRDWLARFGSRVLGLLEAQAARRDFAAVPTFRQPELVQLCSELDVPCPAPVLKLSRALKDLGAIPRAPLPVDLRAELRSYQQQGVDWLCFLRDSSLAETGDDVGPGLGAMLADDMGLGKTLQAMCALDSSPGKRALIVCPTSVLSSWQAQLAQFRPSLRTSLYYGSARTLDPSAHITLTSYALLRLDREKLNSPLWDTIILDEAQTIKNPDSQIAQAAHQLRGRFRIALSGTPIENRLSDLWSQFQFLNPGLLGERPSGQSPDPIELERLRARIRPFILRRLKREVAPELPERTEIVLHCELSPEEQNTYDAILAATRAEVLQKLETDRNVFAALEALLRLRQACCHPALVPGHQRAKSTSSKLTLLLETLEESIGLGHRALIFSQWTSYLDLIEPELSRAGISFSRLDGSTRDRAAVVDDFQREGGPSVLLLSLKAGGTGLTLTAADHIFILDPWWNPAAEDQAADRAHRIGQRNPVLIHRLVAKGTVEDRILLLQKQKLALAASVLDGSGASASLTAEDLRSLIE